LAERLFHVKYSYRKAARRKRECVDVARERRTQIRMQDEYRRRTPAGAAHGARGAADCILYTVYSAAPAARPLAPCHF
jgi:hypothetical protein